jgi:hypothetical protein
MKRQYIYSTLEDSEVLLVSERNNAGLGKGSNYCLNRQATDLPS